jgi:hypothetical protein
MTTIKIQRTLRCRGSVLLEMSLKYIWFTNSYLTILFVSVIKLFIEDLVFAWGRDAWHHPAARFCLWRGLQLQLIAFPTHGSGATLPLRFLWSCALGILSDRRVSDEDGRPRHARKAATAVRGVGVAERTRLVPRFSTQTHADQLLVFSQETRSFPLTLNQGRADL